MQESVIHFTKSDHPKKDAMTHFFTHLSIFDILLPIILLVGLGICVYFLYRFWREGNLFMMNGIILSSASIILLITLIAVPVASIFFGEVGYYKGQFHVEKIKDLKKVNDDVSEDSRYALVDENSEVRSTYAIITDKKTIDSLHIKKGQRYHLKSDMMPRQKEQEGFTLIPADKDNLTFEK